MVEIQRPLDGKPVSELELTIGISQFPEWITFEDLQQQMEAESSDLALLLVQLQAKGKIKCKDDLYMPLEASETVEQLKDDVANTLGADVK